jgi:CheY-like chemotaxis protein
MRRLLVVEDEESLRHGMVRALGKLADVEVTGAGSVREALAYIDATPPDALISDLDLPDRLGAELLGELERRGLPIPVTFVSAHTVNLGARIPRSARIRVVDKPISLERLRELGRSMLVQRDSELPPPFGPADYLQLACLGRHSVVITHRNHQSDASSDARVLVWRGELWSAQDEYGTGEAAFQRIVVRSGAFRCHTIERDPGPREIENGWEMLLLDALRREDESALEAALETTPLPRRETTARTYDQALDDGVGALLVRDFLTARRAFEEALQLRPGDALATANLERLRALGHLATQPDLEGEP